MPGNAESLNVSQAGAILMFMLSQGLWSLAMHLHGPKGVAKLQSSYSQHAQTEG